MRTVILLGLFFAACHSEPAARAPAQPPAAKTPAPATRQVQSEDPEVAKLRGFKEQACACKDKPCVDAVQQDLIAWSYKDQGRDTPPSDADAKSADELMKAFEQCVVAAGGKL